MGVRLCAHVWPHWRPLGFRKRRGPCRDGLGLGWLPLRCDGDGERSLELACQRRPRQSADDMQRLVAEDWSNRLEEAHPTIPTSCRWAIQQHAHVAQRPSTGKRAEDVRRQFGEVGDRHLGRRGAVRRGGGRPVDHFSGVQAVPRALRANAHSVVGWMCGQLHGDQATLARSDAKEHMI